MTDQTKRQGNEVIFASPFARVISWKPTGALRWANVSKTETSLQQEWAATDGPEREWRDVPTVLLYEPDV